MKRFVGGSTVAFIIFSGLIGLAILKGKLSGGDINISYIYGEQTLQLEDVNTGRVISQEVDSRLTRSLDLGQIVLYDETGATLVLNADGDIRGEISEFRLVTTPAGIYEQEELIQAFGIDFAEGPVLMKVIPVSEDKYIAHIITGDQEYLQLVVDGKQGLELGSEIIRVSRDRSAELALNIGILNENPVVLWTHNSEVTGGVVDELLVFDPSFTELKDSFRIDIPESSLGMDNQWSHRVEDGTTPVSSSNMIVDTWSRELTLRASFEGGDGYSSSYLISGIDIDNGVVDLVPAREDEIGFLDRGGYYDPREFATPPADRIKVDAVIFPTRVYIREDGSWGSVEEKIVGERGAEYNWPIA